MAFGALFHKGLSKIEYLESPSPFLIMAFIWLFLLLLQQYTLASQPQTLLSSSHRGANINSSKENANLIFNSIHSAMRQWGSSVQHNGMSFFPAYVPEGTLFYHGGDSADRVIGLEWLAFEVPHAEMFACQRPNKGSSSGGGDGQHTLSPLSAESRHSRAVGYLHVYQATRPLRLLYIDGMAASNSLLGTLDTQDLLLLDFKGGLWSEWRRGRELCDIIGKWGFEGAIRMEAGFEIIKCDFSDGLDFISHFQCADSNRPEGHNGRFMFDYMRDVAGRYQGIDSERVAIDYSSMISVGFYPANLTNPVVQRAELPRLVSTDKEILQQIREDAGEVLQQSQGEQKGVNWQGFTDMIVKRYSDRLLYLASNPAQHDFLADINQMLNFFVDYGDASFQDPVETCAMHYLRPVRTATMQDVLILAAMETVTHRICSTLFEVRTLLLDHEGQTYRAEPDGQEALPSTANTAVSIVTDLMTWLDWTTWKTCGQQCGPDEVCFIAMFPFGAIDDHYRPHCINNSEIVKHDSTFRGGLPWNQSYWLQGVFDDAALGKWSVFKDGA